MIKTNLPVLILRNIVLFPYSEIRIEIDNIEDKKLISLAESYYNNNILVVTKRDSDIDNDIDNIDLNQLPKVGVVGEIKLKMDMPNGKMRLVIAGVTRNKVYAYSEDDNVLDSMVGNATYDELDSIEEAAYARSLIKQVELYINSVPQIGNSLLSQISNISNIDKLTDLVALFLPFPTNRKIDYIEEINPVDRVKMLLDDINQDLEIIKLEKKIEDEVRVQLDEAQKEFVLREKLKAIKSELGDVSSIDDEIEELSYKIDKLSCPPKIKKRLEEELHRYMACNPNSPENSNIRNYIEYLLQLPWQVYTKDNLNLNDISRKLDASHYGLKEIKERIIEYIAVKQYTHNKARSPIICFVGPPGVGKTTLAKSIANSLNRKCVKISVGGVNDEAEIVGHRRTYIGAAPGKIISGMKKAGSSNPVFIIDEIDKMTKDIKGDPASALLDVLDKEQNNKFVDLYIEEEYDLSKVMFILTANYIENIPYELLDRLEIIELSSYTEVEKLEIAKNHLIKKLLKEHGLTQKDVEITDDAVSHIIKYYTKEAGVRELERMLSTILRKIVKDILANKSKKSYKVDVSDLKDYLKEEKFSHLSNTKENDYGVVNALSYTPFGGELLKIEAISYKGDGKITITGLVGKVMEESIQAAISYIKSKADYFEIDLNLFKKNDFHIHIPEGAVRKDGPSAGVAITTAILSLLKKVKIPNSISMTGEITLVGDILPVGGIYEKMVVASKNDINKVFIPVDNKSDINSLPDYVKEKVTFIPVEDYIDIYNELFKKEIS